MKPNSMLSCAAFTATSTRTQNHLLLYFLMLVNITLYIKPNENPWGLLFCDVLKLVLALIPYILHAIKILTLMLLLRTHYFLNFSFYLEFSSFMTFWIWILSLLSLCLSLPYLIFSSQSLCKIWFLIANKYLELLIRKTLSYQ